MDGQDLYRRLNSGVPRQMIFAKVRLCLNAEGQYMDAQICIEANEIPQGAVVVSAFCWGYYAACGFKAVILEIRGHASSSDYYKIPEDIDRLQLRLLQLRGTV